MPQPIGPGNHEHEIFPVGVFLEHSQQKFASFLECKEKVLEKHLHGHVRLRSIDIDLIAVVLELGDQLGRIDCLFEIQGHESRDQYSV